MDTTVIFALVLDVSEVFLQKNFFLINSMTPGGILKSLSNDTMTGILCYFSVGEITVLLCRMKFKFYLDDYCFFPIPGKFFWELSPMRFLHRDTLCLHTSSAYFYSKVLAQHWFTWDFHRAVNLDKSCVTICNLREYLLVLKRFIKYFILVFRDFQESPLFLLLHWYLTFQMHAIYKA